MDNGIFGLAMYGALKRDDVNYIETKKGLVTLAELVAFYENFSEQPQEVKEKKSEKRPKRPRKRKDRKDSTEGKD